MNTKNRKPKVRKLPNTIPRLNRECLINFELHTILVKN